MTTLLRACFVATLCCSVLSSAERPNILFIMTDDMGYADLGCYGGDINTPNLDALASNGLRYSQFYNTARCWTSRVSLMTGYYHDQMGNKGAPKWAKMLTHHLKEAGYRTYHSGKWHLQKWFKMPLANGGFDRSYYKKDNLGFFTATDHFLDDKKLAPISEEGEYYTTTGFTDYLIEFLTDHQANYADQPFFGYLAYTAPHFPLHAKQSDIDRYATHYSDGWDARRERILARQKEIGLINASLSVLEPEILAPSGNEKQRALLGEVEVAHAVDWSALTDAQKEFQTMKMRIHAAMIDCVDQEVGKLVNFLKKTDQFDNTLIFFLSDNGASAEILVRGHGHDPQARNGSARSYYCLGPGWSSSSNTPFRRHKIWTHEGGIATPLIAHWPVGLRAKGELRHQLGHIIDLTPTALAVAGVAMPTPANGPAMPGRDLTANLTDNQPIQRDALFFHHAGNRALRVGQWKIVSAAGAKNNSDPWALYDLTSDRAEQNNLVHQHPERLAEMMSQWETMKDQYKHDAKR